jgi:hypothetical protein
MSLLKSIPSNPSEVPTQRPTMLTGVLGILVVLALVDTSFLLGHLRDVPFHDVAAVQIYGVSLAAQLAAIVALIIGRGEIGRRITQVIATLGLLNGLSVLTQVQGPADDTVLGVTVLFTGMYAFILWALERSEVAIWYAARARRAP